MNTRNGPEENTVGNIDGGGEEGALESAEGFVARSAGTGEPGDASGEGFGPAFSALLSWGLDKRLVKPVEDFSCFARCPTAKGREHDAWFDEPSARWLKATFPNKFGLAWGRDGSATAREYLARLVLQKHYFNDDNRLVAIVNCSGKMRILTSQRHVKGGPASYEQIQNWLRSLGFTRLEIDGQIAWYREFENLLVADAHQGNVILSPNGEMYAIDLNMIQPHGPMKQWAITAIAEIAA